jgi:hypothetical protein
MSRVPRVGKRTNTSKASIEKGEEKRPVGIHNCIWNDITKMNPKRMNCEDAEWIHPGEDSVQWRTLVNMAVRL